jgi:hypothetical protein
MALVENGLVSVMLVPRWSLVGLSLRDPRWRMMSHLGLGRSESDAFGSRAFIRTRVQCLLYKK